MLRRLLVMCLISPVSGWADTVVPTHTIRPNTIVSAQDFTTVPGDVPGAFDDISLLQGLEARVALYPGRPVLRSHVGAPALVERNMLVRLFFASGGLEIMTEGRALSRGAAGDAIRVMNLASRTTLTGRVQPDGSIKVNSQ